MAEAPAPWICPTSRKTVHTPFCASCGERPLQPRDLTLRGLSIRLLHAVTSIDGRLLRSIARLLRAPGGLTLAYVAGERKPYIAPFQLFLLANVLFFAVQSLTHTSIFGATLDSHLHQQDWSAAAQAMVAQRLQHTSTTLAAYAPVFDRVVVLHAKSLVILMTLPFALLCALFFAGSRKPFITHVAFALHLYTFLLLLFCLDLALVGLNALFGGADLRSAWVDNLLSALNLLACTAYLYFATEVVFAVRGPWRGVRAVVLAVAAAAIVVGYRFVLFVITLYTT